MCKFCGYRCDTFRGLSNHIKNVHGITSKEYHILIHGPGKCKICGSDTEFKNLNIGFRDFCSVKCANVYKGMQDEIRKKISLAQKDKPRKRHSKETKTLISKNSKKQWKNNRDKMLSVVRDIKTRQKISMSLTGSDNFFGFKTKINKLIRSSDKYQEWRLMVFGRDNFTC